MRRGRRGAALVELALTLPLLLLILLGIVEFGMIMHGQVMLVQGAREGARSAAIGRPMQEVVDTTKASLPGKSAATVRAQFRATPDGPWESLTNTADGKSNAAPRNAMLRVTIEGYRHQMVTGSFFSWLPGYDRGSIPMSAEMVMRRE